MRCALLILGIALAGCSGGAKGDLRYVSQARSAAAEWALVNAQAAHGKLTTIYIRRMREDVRQELEDAIAGLSDPKAAYANEMKAVLAEPDDADPAQLQRHVDRFKQIER